MYISFCINRLYHYKGLHDIPLYGHIIFYFNNAILLDYVQHFYNTNNIVFNVHEYVDMYMCINMFLYMHP